MTAEKSESSRNLLDQIEGNWDSPRPPAAAPAGLDAATLDAAADRRIETLEPPPVSVPTMADLDGGWEDLEGEGEGEGDRDEDEDEDEDEEAANEPELPDERLDPVAYAEAKQARDARIEARTERRRLKAEAKKARRKARVDAQKQKQKQKTRKAGTGARLGALAAGAAKAELKTKGRAKADARRADRPGAPHTEGSAQRETGVDEPHARKPSPNGLAKPMLSRTNTWMLGFALVIFVAAAIFAAVVAR